MGEDKENSSCGQEQVTVDDRIRFMKAQLRVGITYAIVFTLLVATMVKLLWFLNVGEYIYAQHVFNIITPIATATIGFWFGRNINAK